MITRSRERISIKDFRDFSVILKLQEEYIMGYLGNISEKGLNMICSIETDLPENSDSINGKIISVRLDNPIRFSGRIAWHSVVTYQSTKKLSCGIEFIPPHRIAGYCSCS